MNVSVLCISEGFKGRVCFDISLTTIQTLRMSNQLRISCKSVKLLNLQDMPTKPKAFHQGPATRCHRFALSHFRLFQHIVLVEGPTKLEVHVQPPDQKGHGVIAPLLIVFGDLAPNTSCSTSIAVATFCSITTGKPGIRIGRIGLLFFVPEGNMA